MILREHPGLVSNWTEHPGGVGRAPVEPIENRDVLVSVTLSRAPRSDKPLLTITAKCLGKKRVRDIFVRNDQFDLALTKLLQTQIGKTVCEIGQAEFNF
jgi:hypothetical protein